MAKRIIKEELTVDSLRELLYYDVKTGEFTWRVSCKGTKAGDRAGTDGSEGRRHIVIGYARFKAHRLAWFYVYGVWPKRLIDHINGDPTDNRIENLREATMRENMYNQRDAHKHNKTGVLGVQWRPTRNKFRARIVVAGKEIHLGHFDTVETAQAAYLEAKRRHHQLSPE